MKFDKLRSVYRKPVSLPAWGAWVEILLVNVKLLQSRVAPWMEATCLDAIGAYCYVPEGLVRTSKGRE